jgi:Transposase
VLRDNSPPADKRLTICHTGRGPNRNTHALATTATASNASATPLPAGNTDPSSGSSATAQRVNNARINSARPTNLRSQPRTVSAGTPNRDAIPRHPSPATFASIASPITATSSWRRNNTTSGSSTCVPKQPRHRARRGTSNRSPDRQRNTRSRPCPHGPNTHDTTGTSIARPPTPPRPAPPRHIRSTSGATSRHPESPPDDDQSDGRALARSGTRQACQPPRPPGPTINCANAPAHAEIKLRSHPFARPRSEFTGDFECLVAWLATRTEKTTIMQVLRIDWCTVGRIIKRVCDDELDADRLNDLYDIGIDEVSWKRQHNYLTLVANHRRGKIVWGCGGKGEKAADAFFAELDPAPAAPSPPPPPRGPASQPHGAQAPAIMVPFGPCPTVPGGHGIPAAWLTRRAPHRPPPAARDAHAGRDHHPTGARPPRPLRLPTRERRRLALPRPTRLLQLPLKLPDPGPTARSPPSAGSSPPTTAHSPPPTPRTAPPTAHSSTASTGSTTTSDSVTATTATTIRGRLHNPCSTR